MGVTFTHLLLPKPRSRTPTVADMARLIDSLVRGGFLLSSNSPRLPLSCFGMSKLNRHAAATGCYIQSRWNEAISFPCPPSAKELVAVSHRDFKLVWPVVDFGASGLRYPLTIWPEKLALEDLYYDVEIQLSRQHVYRTSELIEPFASLSCEVCEADLSVLEDESHDDFDIDTWGLGASYLYRLCPNCGVEFHPEDRTALVQDPRGHSPAREIKGGATSRFALVVECGKCWEYGAVPTEEFLSASEAALGFSLEHVLDGTF